MARAIEGKVAAFTRLNPSFDVAFCTSAIAQDRPVLSDTEVITGEAPTRYAQALLDLAEETKSLARVEKDLKSFKKMYDSSVDLKRLAESPVFATEDKVAALTAVAKKAKLSVLTQQFIGTVAGNRRASDLPGIISAFNDMVARRRGSQVAKVTSAAKLTAAQTTAIKSQLKKSLGRPVDIETSVDPDLLGGFVVRIGSRLYDSSLKTKLEDLRLALKEA
jgi:F-type H+-transporting ATPase subunit delta